MTVTLEKALEQVSLAPGQTYRCRVNGMRVELRVISEMASVGPAPISESDIVLDPWAEFPLPAGVQVQVRTGAVLLPDPPDIPPQDEEHLAKHFADTYSRIGLPEPYASAP